MIRRAFVRRMAQVAVAGMLGADLLTRMPERVALTPYNIPELTTLAKPYPGHALTPTQLSAEMNQILRDYLEETWANQVRASS